MRILSNGDSKLGNRLVEVADRYLGIELRKDQGSSDWGALMLLAEQIQYAAQDVEHLHALKEKLDAELKAAALMGVLRLEMDLLPVVIGMDLIGVCVDRKKLEELAAKATQERDQVAQTVHNLLGTGDVNLNVPAQFLKALQGLGIALKNTNEDSLSECRHPVADAILEYRKWKKLKEDVESCIHEIRSDGRIHGQFNPLGTDTGRFSSSEPNMQHIRRRELRPPLWHQSGMFWLPGDGRKGSGNRRCDIGKQAGPECQPRTSFASPSPSQAAASIQPGVPPSPQKDLVLEPIRRFEGHTGTPTLNVLMPIQTNWSLTPSELATAQFSNGLDPLRSAPRDLKC